MDKRIGRFEIRRELGRGAESTVYLAWDPQLQREVAIKTLHFDATRRAEHARLLQEARTVSRLRHPNVVPIFDAGEQDGDPYLVFEYVPGGTLAEHLQGLGRLAPPQAAALMRGIVDGLAQAHAQGIIHRDLKPSNILMDAAGAPRVMDFGISARVDNPAVPSQILIGTPAYMAPEYIKAGQVSEQMDIFAAGLILAECLTGRRVAQGDSLEEIIACLCEQEVKLPPAIDDRLADIILRACARDPAQRYANVVVMRDALDQYLGSADNTGSDAEARKQTTLAFLLRRMRHKSDFPALSDSVSAINKLTNSDRESVNRLSNSILKDYALTNKILRLVNSAFYRQAGGGNISTVSRAVIVLGFDSIRNIAVTVLLFEHLQDKANARELKEAFLRCNLAGLLAKDVGKKFMARDTEEAFICSLFHDLGKLLAQYYFPEEMDTLRIAMQQKKIGEDQAAAQVLGISFEELGTGIARNWGFPNSIVNAMRKLGDGPVKKPTTHDETLRVLAGFSNELCTVMAAAPKETRSAAISGLSHRFAASMSFSETQLKSVVDKSFEELGELAQILHVNMGQSPFARQVKSFAHGDTLLEDNATLIPPSNGALAATVLNDSFNADSAGEGRGEASEGGVEVDMEAILAAGIQDISNSLLEDFSLNDILRIILETIYRAAGFKRVLLCLKDPRSNQMAGRFGFGPDAMDMAKKFHFPLAYSADVFHLAISKGADVLISDIGDPKISDKIPAWYRALTGAQTFTLFPLCIKGNPVALIYCDKDKAGSIVIPEKSLQLLKTLRNQAILAIKQTA